MGSKRWETPPDYFGKRWALHHFTVDAAASDTNALVRPPGRFYTEDTDGLEAAHYKPGDRVWCNPPYDHSLLKWVGLARELSQDAGVLWDMLLPVSGATRWFMRYVWNDAAGHWRDGVEGHYIGRVQFLLDGKVPLDKQGRAQSSRQENLQITFWPGGKS